MSLAKKLRPHAVNLALVGAALVGGAVYLADRANVSTGESVVRKRKLLEAWRGDDVTEIVLVAHGHTTKLRRGAADAKGQRAWELEIDGRRSAAEEPRVDALLSSLELGTYERVVPPESVNRGAFGLDAPRATIAVAMGARSYRVAIGGTAPAPEGAAYAEVNGRGVVVVTRELAAALDVAPETLRARGLVPVTASDLGGIRLDGQGGPRHLVRAAWSGGRGAGFRFDGSTAEGRARADALVLDRVLGSLEQLRADEFVPDDVADAASRREITVALLPKDAGAAPTELVVGGLCAGKDDHVLVVRHKPTRVSACVGKGLVEPLAVPAERLVDKHLVGAPIDEVSEVDLTAGGSHVDLARAGAGWHLRAPEDRTLDGDTGRSFVDGLLRLSAERLMTLADAKGAAFDKPRAVLRVRSVGGSSLADGGLPTPDAAADRVEVLEVGAEIDGLVAVHRVEDDVVALVPKAEAAALHPNELGFKPLKLFDEPVGRVRSVRVERGGAVQRFEQVAGVGFRYLEPAGQAIDQGLAGDVATLLGRLTAARWVAAKDDGSFGLASPRVRIEVAFGDEGDAAAKPHVIVLGGATQEGAFARVDDGPVFVAPLAIEQAASRWLVDRNALLFVPNDLARVTLADATGKRKLAVERTDAGAFRVVGPGGDGPEASRRAASVREAFSQLLPEGAVSLGAPEASQGLAKPRLVVTLELLPGRASVGSPPPAGDKPLVTRLSFGAADAWQGTNVVYVRREGVDATFAVARARAQPLLDALGVE